MKLGILCGFIILLFASTVMATEEPKFTVVEKSGAFELRAYAPRVVAETLVDGSLNDASSAGFKLIADYIFGNNTSRAGASEKISMTAPVSMAPNAEKSASEKISMTAPVGMQQKEGKWRMYFTMPSQYTVQTLPTPNNPAVTLHEVPASHYAVISFSGLAGEEKTTKKTTELINWLASKNIKPIGTPELARYNPPWTLPFLRRNEVMVEY
ncbi:MAG: heme-binding protein [Methylophilaceae bacterium]